MDQEQDLDLLDLEEETSSVDTLPEAAPFTSPRPKKPWLLMGLGIAIIALATWIIIARVGGDSGTSVNIDLDTPGQQVEEVPQPVADLNVPAKPVEVAPQPMPPHPAPVPPAPVAEKPVPQPMPAPAPVANPAEANGVPVRVIQDRKEVTFNPDKGETKTVTQPAPKPAAKPAAKPAPKPAPKTTASTATTANGIYVQFGSYGTRAAAQSAEQKLRASHSNLFSGKQFVILSAQVNGKTTYRLRIAFQNANDANGFCRNAKSDGLDCYVTK